MKQMVANAEAGQGVFALVCWQVISALISITEYRWNRSENTGKNGENDPVFRSPDLKGRRNSCTRAKSCRYKYLTWILLSFPYYANSVPQT